MGWGTFIAGRALRQPRYRKSTSDLLMEGMQDLTKRQTIFETEVLREIQRLQAEGKEVDLVKVRADMRKLRSAYKHLGPNLELRVVREAQRKTLAGEEVNYAQIEKEILDSYQPFPWGKAFAWVFFPYIPAFMRIYGKFKESQTPK